MELRGMKQGDPPNLLLLVSWSPSARTAGVVFLDDLIAKCSRGKLSLFALVGPDDLSATDVIGKREGHAAYDAYAFEIAN